jgi:hypothetical protein
MTLFKSAEVSCNLVASGEPMKFIVNADILIVEYGLASDDLVGPSD